MFPEKANFLDYFRKKPDPKVFTFTQLICRLRFGTLEGFQLHSSSEK